jgi:2-succinyl-6-hydroxy-2,4-cyclohexadiene-1-carboxylate synthase
VVRVDLPGHGGSADVRADLPTTAELLMDAGPPEPATYLGYSMGARVCLHLALAHPERVDRLILVSGTAGIDDPDERRERRRADERLADRLDPPDGSGPAVTLAAFLAEWVANPLFGDVPAAAQGMEERLRNTPAGLASSLRLAGTGTQEPLWGRLAGLPMPVLVITGENDAKFVALGRRLVASIGDRADQVVIPGTHHSPHLQRPGAVADAIAGWMG